MGRGTRVKAQIATTPEHNEIHKQRLFAVGDPFRMGLAVTSHRPIANIHEKSNCMPPPITYTFVIA